MRFLCSETQEHSKNLAQAEFLKGSPATGGVAPRLGDCGRDALEMGKEKKKTDTVYYFCRRCYRIVTQLLWDRPRRASGLVEGGGGTT